MQLSPKGKIPTWGYIIHTYVGYRFCKYHCHILVVIVIAIVVVVIINGIIISSRSRNQLINPTIMSGKWKMVHCIPTQA
jgi:hypothetical protein